MKFLIPLLIGLSLVPSVSFSAEGPLKENVLLASCDKISIDSLDYIVVEVANNYPGLAQVKILYTDKSVKSIMVGMQEWLDKSISLPSVGPVTYRLVRYQQNWNIARYGNSLSITPVHCTTSI